MKGKKILSIAIVALFIASSAVAVLTTTSESSDAAQTYVADYYPGNIVYKIVRNSGDSYAYGVPANDTAKVKAADALAQAYANGDTNNLEIPTVSVGPHTDYYRYATYRENYDTVSQMFRSEKTTTYVPIGPGTYKLFLKSATHLGVDIGSGSTIMVNYSENGNYYTNKPIEVESSIEFTVNGVTSFYFSISRSISATFTYELTPAPITEQHEAKESYQFASQYGWYAGEMDLNPASYVQVGARGMYVISDPEKQALFEDEIIKENKVYVNTVESKNRYGVLTASYSDPLVISSTTHVKMYMLSSYTYKTEQISLGVKDSSGGTRYEYRTVTMSSLTPTAGETYSFYASAYSTFDVCVDYDLALYNVYLNYTSDSSYTYKTLLVPGILYHIENGQAKTYTVSAEIKTNGNAIDLCDSLMIDVDTYVSGLPTSDSNIAVFAVVCIAICAIVFGLLIRSGKKPSWSKDKTQK